MNKRALIGFIAVKLFGCIFGMNLVWAHTNPLHPYGDKKARSAITEAMYFKSEVEVIKAIDNAKKLLGIHIGCPEIKFDYLVPDFTPVDIMEVERVWNEKQKPGFQQFDKSIPLSGRMWPMVVLGGCYAGRGGYDVDNNIIQEVASSMYGQQYLRDNLSNDKNCTGVYGLAVTDNNGNSIYQDGIVGQNVKVIAEVFPHLTKKYNRGLYKGYTFLIGDIDINSGFVSGGLAYDHAWTGIMMLEISKDTVGKFSKKALYSAEKAGDWCILQPPLANHNFTAKSVCLLAKLYAETGKEKYEISLRDKLRRNLLPAVLMDMDYDGIVDGTEQQFNNLCSVAKVPGRIWDAHNSSAPYQAINTWAMVEAYAAYRKRGHDVFADELFIYAVTMLDNLAWEINEYGIPPSRDFITQMMHALLTGVNEIAIQDKGYTDWNRAIAALWNSRHTSSFGPAAINVGLLLQYLQR